MLNPKNLSVYEKNLLLKFKPPKNVIRAESYSSNYPIEYIVKKSFFYKDYFNIENGVLIPRCETEILVQKTLKFIRRNFKSKDFLTIADIGCGCGNILISILKDLVDYKNIKPYATDINPIAIKLAQKNEIEILKKNFITFKLGNLAEPIYSNIKEPTIIAANLPYVKNKKNISKQSLKYEPLDAILSKNGTTHYSALLDQIKSKFNLIKFIIIEIDPPNLLQTKKIIKSKLPKSKIKIIKDQNNKNRFIEIFHSFR